MTGFSYGARSIWGQNPDAVTALRELLESKKTAGDVAKELTEKFGVPITRNSVIGKAKRLGFQLLSHLEATRINKTGPKPKPVRDVDYISYKPRPPSAKARETVAIPTSRRVSLMDLTWMSCRWPLGDPRDAYFCYCGADRVNPFDDNRSYCSAHTAIAYAPSVGKVNLKVRSFSNSIRAGVQE